MEWWLPQGVAAAMQVPAAEAWESRRAPAARRRLPAREGAGALVLRDVILSLRSVASRAIGPAKESIAPRLVGSACRQVEAMNSLVAAAEERGSQGATWPARGAFLLVAEEEA